MLRQRFLVSMCAVTLLVGLFSASASASPPVPTPTPAPVSPNSVIILTAPAEYPELKGMQIKVPAAVQTPSEDQLWRAVLNAKTGRNKELVKLISEMNSGKVITQALGYYPVYWYEGISADTSHTKWITGATAYNNNYSQPSVLEAAVKTTVSSSFKGSWAAKQFVALTFDVSFSASFEIASKMTITVPARTNAALFASAWGVQHTGKVHWDWFDGNWVYHRGSVSNVSFFLLNSPVEPIFEPVEGQCYACKPKPPNW